MFIDDRHKEWIARQILFSEALDEIDLLFSTAGIRYLPIKGAHLIVSGLAEKMSWRRMDDIDLMVHPEDFDSAVQLFLQTNRAGVAIGDCNYPFKRTLRFESCIGGVAVEIHAQLSHEQRFTISVKDLFSRSRLHHGYCYVCCPEDAALITIAHALVHIGFELRESIFNELMLYVECADFNWKDFWLQCRESGVYGFAVVLMRWTSFSTKCRPVYKYHLPIYAHILSTLFSLQSYRNLPLPVKRLLFETPFLKNPVSLILNKYFRK